MDFVAEFARAPKMEAIIEPARPPTWNPFVDDSSREAGFGATVVLESSESHRLNCAIRFSFKASKNVTECSGLLGILRLAKEIQVRRFFINSDFQSLVT